MKKQDPLLIASTKLLGAADAWERAVAPTRCQQCNARVHRTEAEMKLAAAVADWRAALRQRKAEKFDEESPTQKRKKPTT